MWLYTLIGAAYIAMLPARFLSFTGCEARSYAYLHIRFTLNATSSNPSNHRLTSSTIHYVLAKRSFLLRFHSWYGWRNQYTWPFWKYSVRHSSIQVILIQLECHIVIPAKSQIDLSKNNTGIQLRETNSSATKREYVWRDQLTRSIRYTLSDLCPYKLS